MGRLLRPVGPMPAAAYWVRRGLLLIMIVLVVLLVRAGWPFGGAAEPTVNALPTPSEPPAAAVEPTPSAPPTTVEPSISPSPEPVLADCPDTAIGVTVSTDAKIYRAGVDPAFTLTVSNTGSVACQRDVGGKALSLVVTSGEAHVWSSDDCPSDAKSIVVPLAPGAKVATSVRWDRVLSAKNCPSGLPDAGNGTYVVAGSAGGVTGPRAVFTLR